MKKNERSKRKLMLRSETLLNLKDVELSRLRDVQAGLRPNSEPDSVCSGHTAC